MVSDSFKPQSEAAPDAPRAQRERWKREDCEIVKHDKCFSDWKVLVGPSDWKEHASGKEGAERFRARNLPSGHVGPGVYELGVTPPAWLPVQNGSRSGFLRPQDVVVVYVGHAENIRQRLQRYGQAGAHLEGSRSTRLFVIKNDQASKSWKTDLQNSDDRRMSTDERRMSTDDRRVSTDGRRTSTGDRRASGDDRRISIDERRVSLDLRRTSTDERRDSTDERPVEPMSPEHGGCRSPRGPRLFSEIFAFGCSIAFRWAATDSKAVAERVESELMEVFDYAWNRGGSYRQRSPDILAKLVMGGGAPRAEGSRRRWFFSRRKRVGIRIAARRPEEAGERRNRASGSKVGDFFMLLKNSTVGGKAAKACEFTKLDIPVERCGVSLETGLPCSALRVKGQKRCLAHKDMKRRSQRKPIRVAHTSQNTPTHEASGNGRRDSNRSPSAAGPPPSPGLFASCFPFLASPPVQQSAPQESKRRGSLSFNTWLRTSQLQKARSMEWMAAVEEANGGGLGVNLIRLGLPMEGWRRSGIYNSTLSTWQESQNESPARREICGLRLEDGTVCSAPPRPDRKRCYAHKGLRSNGLRSPSSGPRSPNNPFSLQASS